MEYRRIGLSTGMTLGVLTGGSATSATPLLFLHGFPESHRTWRHQLAAFATERGVAAPDQRGYAGSTKPAAPEDYRPDRLIADAIALADALAWDRFVLIGHDWGGAVAWATALAHGDRLAGLVIVNAPHPYRFQQTLVEDAQQRAASQYINDYRAPDLPARVARMGMATWFDQLFAPQLASGALGPCDRDAYVAEWGVPGTIDAMLAWYRASPVHVPLMDEDVLLPWLGRPFPTLELPVQLIWGMDDHALLPLQIEGLETLVPDLRIRRIENAGHFAPWEAPQAVTSAIKGFLTELHA